MATAVDHDQLDQARWSSRFYSILASTNAYVRRYRTPIVLAIVALALRIPFLSTSIDEIDSANFVNALDNGYNVPLLRPHAPGYPVYLFFGGLVRPIVGDSVTALALMSATLGSLTVIPFYALAKEFVGYRLAVIGTLLLIVNPLFWTFGETALSDVPSVFAVVTLAWLAYRGRVSDRALVVAAIVASLAIGIRQPNVAFLPLLAYPFVYRAIVGQKPWKSRAVLSMEVFLATTAVWAAPMILIGSEGLADYVAALTKQWGGAVQPYNILHVGSPWILNAPERVERFVVGYLFTHPWTGVDARTGVASALQLPWIFGLALFLSRFSLRNPRHNFLMIWILSIAYQIATIHFLPRYGLSILPALVIASLIGYGFLRDDLIHDRRRVTLISLIAIGSLLILIGVKHQPPVASFEWVSPKGTIDGAILVLSGIAVLLGTRVYRGEPSARVRPKFAPDTRRTFGGHSWHPVEATLGAFVILLTLVSWTMVSTVSSDSSPNQRLVEFARDTWDMDQVTVCWDGQTHGYFEVLSPGVTPRGFWTIDELKSGALTGDTLLVTDYCVRFDEVAALVDLEKVAEFRGSNPVWSKAPTITLFAGHLGDPSR